MRPFLIPAVPLISVQAAVLAEGAESWLQGVERKGQVQKVQRSQERPAFQSQLCQALSPLSCQTPQID